MKYALLLTSLAVPLAAADLLRVGGLTLAQLFPLGTCNCGDACGAQFIITTYGAKGDNATISTHAISNAIAAASSAGGGLVVVPPGVFLTGSVNLTSCVYLAFQPGGALQGSPNSSDYNWDWDYWHVVQALNASNTGVIGLDGVDAADRPGIHGNMWQMTAGWNSQQQAWIPKPWTGVSGCIGECRVKNLAFIDCDNVIVANVGLYDSSDWTTLYRRTSNVLIENVTISGSTQWPNGDGMDVESGSNVTVRGANISTGDDCIALRSGNCNQLRTPWPQPWGRIQPLTGVRVLNCTLRSSSAAIKIEALFQLDHGPLTDVLVDGVRIHGTNRGVGVWQRIGTGVIANITVQNAEIQTQFMHGDMWWGSGEPIVVTSVPENANQSRYGLPGIHNVSFINITAVSENGALISSRDQALTNPRALTGLTFRNVNVTIARIGNDSVWAQHDYRPIDADGATPNTIPANVSGFYFEHVTQADVMDVNVAFAGAHQPYWTSLCVNGTADSNVTYSGWNCAT